MAIASTASLVDALRQYRLLEVAQLEEAMSLQARFPEPKALARELIQRGWLTPYQANQVLQGKGQELELGSYVLLERLGEGGMGQVFKAKNWKLGRVVALKLVRKDRLNKPDAIRRFEREVRSAAALVHPNIVLAHDADLIGGTHLLVMEYVEGTDLAKLVKMNGPLPVPQACEFIRQAALGLQHAHERGMVHRDVKPANLLLTADGRTIKVLDMGLARLDQPAGDDDKSSTMTQEGMVVGTPDYIAPEQALESHTVDIRGDLYSLGCTFYYLLTGKVPFPGGTLLQKLNKHQNQEAPAVQSMRPDVPPGVAAIVRKLMAKKPEDRYQTPAELATALALIFSPSSGLAVGDDRTLSEGGQVARAETSDHTLESALDYMAQRSDTGAVDSPQRLARITKERRRWLSLAAVGFLVLIGLAVVLFVALKGPARTNTPGNEEDDPVVAAAVAKEKAQEAWLKKVAAMPAQNQVQAVAARLMELNPGFNGKVTPRIENGVVTELLFLTDHVTDISPVRALAGLKSLTCRGFEPGSGKLTDLSPLKGMKLTTLGFYYNPVTDLSPLKDMRLLHLYFRYTSASDLSPLEGMPLVTLACDCTPASDLAPLKDMKLTVCVLGGTKVRDLSPLKDMSLVKLACGHTSASDLSPLKDMKLTTLECDHTNVSDLSPLKDMRLTTLYCNAARVTDLSPLQGMPLKELRCDFQHERDAEILRSIKTLEKINGKPAQEFWQEADAKKLDNKP
jgi:serine/threonine protein kinase